MNKKNIIDNNEGFHSIVDTIESSFEKRKIWSPPTIILLKQFDIQSGDGSGNEGTNLGFWQSSLGS
jgi:hypothetical protein